MRILISLSHLRIGGAQTFVVRLLNELSAKHSVYLYDFEFFSSQHSNNVLGMLQNEVTVLRFSPLLDWVGKKVNGLLRRIKVKFNAWQALRELHFRWLLHDYRIDLVNTHLFHSDYFVTKTLRNSSLPIVLTDHGDYHFVAVQGIGTLEEIQRIFDRADQVIYISDRNLESLSKYRIDIKYRGIKIYNGVAKPDCTHIPKTARERLKIAPVDFVFGMVARGIPEKGWAEAIEAFKQVRSQTQKPIHLVLVGASEYLDSLQQSLEPTIKPFIHFTGHTSEPYYWIDAFNVGLLPTYFPGESLPNSIIEYFSLGKPAIATNVGGIAEMLIVGNEKAGIIVELALSGRGDVAQIAQAMLNYINQDSLVKQHSHLAEQAFEKFSLEKCVDSYEAVFNDLVHSAKP